MLKHTNIDARRRAGANGFTLVELLVVIVILGILAAVVVFAVGGIGDRGQQTACDTEERSIKTAVEAYRAQNPDGELPASQSLLIDDYLEEPPTGMEYNPTGGSAGPPVVPPSDYTVDPIAGGKCAP